MIDLSRILRCLSCRGAVIMTPTAVRCTACSRVDAVENGVPRFVPRDNYAASFGLQWNRFARTQLDSHNGTTISRDRFLAQSRWTERDLSGALVLDGGCGSGRFAEIALSLGAEVVAIDFSSAVDACRSNNGSEELHVLQADLYDLPFAPGSFDFVYSFGVIQHTPDVRGALEALVAQVRPGGRIAVDVYRSSWRQFLHPKFWLRPVTKRVPSAALFGWVERLAPPLLEVSRTVGRVPLVGAALRRALPVANYEGVFPLDEDQLRDFAVLDTFDWLSPRYDQPQSAATLERWMRELGLVEIEIDHPAHMTGRGRRPLLDH
ncbi:MAG: class I SAM-dependent methyltransferase [Deltaproteobacteria bacterium]|nr:class I SAM-dependent methyltransferase [Kofleriaceae bacterium]